MKFEGQVELDNGIVIPWLRFANSAAEALRLVIAELVHVKGIWLDE